MTPHFVLVVTVAKQSQTKNSAQFSHLFRYDPHENMLLRFCDVMHYYYSFMMELESFILLTIYFC